MVCVTIEYKKDFILGLTPLMNCRNHVTNRSELIYPVLRNLDRTTWSMFSHHHFFFKSNFRHYIVPCCAGTYNKNIVLTTRSLLARVPDCAFPVLALMFWLFFCTRANLSRLHYKYWWRQDDFD